MTLEINTDDFWKELDQRVLDARTERKLFIAEIEQLRQRMQELEQQLTEVLERERATKFPDDNFWLKVSERWSE